MVFRRLLSLALVLSAFLLFCGGGIGRAAPAPDDPPDPSPEYLGLLQQIEALLHDRKGGEALPKLDQLLAMARKDGRDDELAVALNTRGACLVVLRRWDDATNTFVEALSAWRRFLKKPRDLVEPLLFGGMGASLAGRPEGEAWISEGLKLAEAETGTTYGVWKQLSEMADLYAGHGLQRQALRVQQTALRMAKRDQYPQRELQSSDSCGTYAINAGETQLAVEYFTQSLELRKTLKQPPLDLAAGAHQLGLAYLARGDLDHAMAFFSEAYEVRRRLAPGSVDEADSQLNIGVVDTARTNFAKAEATIRKSIATREKLLAGGGGEPLILSMAQALVNLGLVQMAQDRFEDATHTYLEALQRLKAGGVRSNIDALCYTNLGVIAFAMGDYSRAGDYYLKALQINEELVPGTEIVALGYANLGANVAQLGDLRKAEAHYQKALDIYRRVAPGSMGMANTLANLASLKLTADPAEAVRLIAEAQELEKRGRFPGLRPGLFLLDGQLSEGRKDWGQARKIYRQALDAQERLTPGSSGAAAIRLYLARVAESAGNRSEAVRWSSESWDLIRKSSERLTGDENRQAASPGVSAAGGRLMHFQIADKRYDQALETAEEIRALIQQQQLMERRELFSGAAGVLWTEHRRFLGAVEASRVSLQAAVKDEESAGDALEAAQARQAEPADISALKQAKIEAADRVAHAREEYLSARAKADGMWEQLHRAAPRAFVSEAAIRKCTEALRPDEALLSFTTGFTETAVVVVRRPSGKSPVTTAYIVALSSEEVSARAQAFRTLASNRNSSLQEVAAAGWKLTQALLPAEQLTGLRNIKRWIIAPDGPLWDVPFAALPLSAPAPGKVPEWLATDHSISLTTSLRQLYESRRSHREGAAARTLVVGNTRAGAGPSAAGGLLARDDDSALPGAAREAKAVASLYHQNPLLGDAATEPVVRRRMEEADLIHLAVHGLYHPTRAMSSGLLLAPPAKKSADPADDGVLQAWEIFSSLKLHARLVVLSACNSGRGKAIPGYGLVGLVRSLQYAGAESVVASQWTVPDESTAALMVRFHQLTLKSSDPAESLRSAEATLRANAKTAHPYYWAPFFLIGGR